MFATQKKGEKGKEEKEEGDKVGREKCQFAYIKEHQNAYFLYCLNSYYLIIMIKYHIKHCIIELSRLFSTSL